MSRIAIVTDAWHPQINGVVTTLTKTAEHLRMSGHEVLVITPQLFRSIPCPTYPEIRLALTTRRTIAKEFHKFAPHAIHIATEGPLGWTARSICIKNNFPFTTSYHTRFPEYLRMRAPIPLAFSYPVVRHFHKQAVRMMVATQALRDELHGRAFRNTCHWSRGVDTDLFHPGAEKPKELFGIEKPIAIYVGRVAVEKNLETFLQLDIPGLNITKVIVGDGPARKPLKQNYPEAYFAGYRKGKELAGYIASANVFVFPSLTDTFGVVLPEAMASGVPVAAFPVTGPINIVQNGVNGWLNDDLAEAVTKALKVSPESCRNSALQYSWKSCSNQFSNNLAIQPSPFQNS